MSDQELSLSEAADALDGLFPEPTEPTEEPTPVEPTEPEEEETEEPEEEDEEKDEEEDEEDDEEEEGEPEPKGSKYLTLLGKDGKPHRVHIDKLLDDTVHTVKVAGETQHVPYKELLNGYSRHADYTRKTMALAEQEAALEPLGQFVAHVKTDPAFREYLEGYFKHQGAPSHLVEASRPEVTEAQLAEALESEDAALRKAATEVLRARAALREHREKYGKHSEQAEAEKARLAAVKRDREIQKLAQFVPDYKEKAPALKAALVDYGFEPDEIANLVDHRIVRLVNDALQGTRSKAPADKPRASAPRVPRSTRGAVSKPTVAAKQQAARLARAKEVDTLDAWADALTGLEL
jgi:hypothetical protein